MARGKRDEPRVPGSLERFQTIKVHRSKLTDAPYNPRVISPAQRRKLREGIETHGMLGPAAIWNVRTGNIVGGHQRVHQLDELYGTSDYELTVAQVELDDKQERQANVLLNNYEAQGAFDIDKLSELFQDPQYQLGAEPAASGFDVADIYRMFDNAPVDDATADQLEELADKVRETRAKYDGLVAKSLDRDTQGYYLLVVFEDQKEREEFCNTLGIEHVREQCGRVMRKIYEEHR